MAADEPVTIPMLQQMKQQGKKSAGFVLWDYQTDLIAERAGADFVVIGDSVGVNLLGHRDTLEVSVDDILVFCKAVRRAITRAVLICDIPFGPLQEGRDSLMKTAVRLVKEGGAGMPKLDAAAGYPEAVGDLTRAGIPVMPQFGLTPQTALKYGIPYSAQNSAGTQATSEMTKQLVAEAKTLEAQGAAMLDFTNSGPTVGPEVV